jgi:tRNA-(ms[2]io[6]A)-hydroxylase
MRLRVATSPDWLPRVLSDFDAFLLDHAMCERKAFASARSLASQVLYPPEIARAMADLAREELEHFHGVLRLCAARGLVLQRYERDEYVRRLLREVRHGPDAYLCDRLLVAGIVEARSCERLGILARALDPGPIRDFYRELTRAEARHHALFVRLARDAFDPRAVESRLEELLEAEARIVAALPLRAAVH